MKLFLTLALFMSISVAHAESEQPKIIYKKHTKIDFGDALVEGQASNPEGVYIVTPPEKQFGNLLKLRANFHRELIRDSLLMK